MNRKNNANGSTRRKQKWAVRFYLVGYLTFVATFLAPINPTQNPDLKAVRAQAQKLELKAQLLKATENPKEMAFRIAKTDYGWGKTEHKCLGVMWGKESAWNHKAKSPTHDYGIPQRHMRNNTPKERAKFLENPLTQIEWGLNYIKVRYGSPCEAWKVWQVRRWY